MRRPFTALVLIFVLALVGSACSKQKDTGFPAIKPSSSGSATPSPQSTVPVTAVTLIGKNISWDLSALYFEANKKVTVTVDNKDQAPHNFALFTDPNRQLGEIFTPKQDAQPGTKLDYAVQPLKAGTYYFECFIHPSMHGTVTVK
jgi:plastocyanin